MLLKEVISKQQTVNSRKLRGIEKVGWLEPANIKITNYCLLFAVCCLLFAVRSADDSSLLTLVPSTRHALCPTNCPARRR